MNEQADPASAPQSPHRRGFLHFVGAWLARPLAVQTSTAGRRQRLLAWMLLSLFVLALVSLAVVLMVDTQPGARRTAYIPFIAGLDVLVAVAYCVNAAGFYMLAAGMTVGVAVLGPWGSLLLDPQVLGGDFVPLAYAIIAVLLSSMLLSPRITGILGAVQLAGFLLIALVDPAAGAFNWPSFLALILVASVLSILSSVIRQHDQDQIDTQTRELEASEAGLRELSVRDHLTGLFNRRYLEESLDREIRRSERAHRTIGVILLDVDQFKQINDRWGHEAGDLVLRQVGQFLRKHIRGGDIACRYGGDEFILVLPEASRQSTRQRAQRLRDGLQALPLEDHGQALGPATISLGVAVYPQHGETRDELVRSADKALYRAKRAGSNRVAVSDGATPSARAKRRTSSP